MPKSYVPPHVVEQLDSMCFKWNILKYSSFGSERTLVEAIFKNYKVYMTCINDWFTNDEEWAALIEDMKSKEGVNL